MRSILFTRRWLVRHAVAIVLIAVCLRLGWWQWDRAKDAGGGVQNLGYALQWPLFGVFVGYAWLRMLRHEAGTRLLEPPVHAQPDSDGPPLRTVQVRRSYTPPARTEAPDEELAAYNRYLASLHSSPPASPGAKPRPATPEEQ